jgi:chloride channel 3/4/5
MIQVMVSQIDESQKCIFSSRENGRSSGLWVDLSEVLDESALQLHASTPKEIILGLFQKLVSFLLPGGCLLRFLVQNLHHILFSSRGKLEGMVTKTDIVSLMMCHFSHTGVLSGTVPGNDWDLLPS